VKYSCPGGGAMLGKYCPNFLFRPSCAGPGLRTLRPIVPTPPGPCRPHDVDALRARLCVETEERVLDARGRDAGDGFVADDAGERERSTDGLGVDAASEYAFDFRRAGGKKPSARRGMRPICVGLWSLGRSTHESCFQGGSVSGLEDMADAVSESFWRGVDQPFGRP
jgi:hypothetical protein